MAYDQDSLQKLFLQYFIKDHAVSTALAFDIGARASWSKMPTERGRVSNMLRERTEASPPPTNVEQSKGLVETQGVFCRRLSEYRHVLSEESALDLLQELSMVKIPKKARTCSKIACRSLLQDSADFAPSHYLRLLKSCSLRQYLNLSLYRFLN